MDLRTKFDGSGFAILPDLFSHNEINRLLQQLDTLSPKRSRAGVRHALGVAPVAELARHPAMMDFAFRVLGSNAFPFRATLFDKSQAANWLVVWHQDTALPLQCRQNLHGWGPWSVKDGVNYAHAPAAILEQVLAVRVSLDDSSHENGPLRVLPGTHTSGVLSDDDIHQLASTISPIDCVSRKGGIVAMRPLIVHSSSKSHADAPRRILHIEYAASPLIAIPLRLAIA